MPGQAYRVRDDEVFISPASLELSKIAEIILFDCPAGCGQPKTASGLRPFCPFREAADSFLIAGLSPAMKK
jgi:hypothetical protein